MRLSLWLLLAALALGGCGASAMSTLETVAINQDFVLAVGQEARLASSDMRVGFDGVVADSRCPRGEQCVWAGEARARVWLQAGTGPRQALELVQRTGSHSDDPTAQGLRLVLVRLDPPAVAGRTLAPADYRLTLKLQRADSIDAAQ